MFSLTPIYKILIAALFFNISIAHAEFVSQNAPDSYGEAKHSNKRWQQLADSSGRQITDPFGISWSTDGGETWGRNSLFVGDSVLFRLSMFKSSFGNHRSDHAKLWLDLDHNGSFSQDEALLYGEQKVNSSYHARQRQFEFYSQQLHLGPEHAGDMWLRGRVVCSESLAKSVGGSWHDQFRKPYTEHYDEIFSPSTSYYQGEKEDWLVNIGFPNGNIIGNVSAPLIGAIGLFFINLGLRSRRKTPISSTQ